MGTLRRPARDFTSTAQCCSANRSGPARLPVHGAPQGHTVPEPLGLAHGAPHQLLGLPSLEQLLARIRVELSGGEQMVSDLPEPCATAATARSCPRRALRRRYLTWR